MALFGKADAADLNVLTQLYQVEEVPEELCNLFSIPDGDDERFIENYRALMESELNRFFMQRDIKEYLSDFSFR